MKTNNKPSALAQLCGLIVGGMAACAIGFLVFWVPAYFEARAYNHATGQNVSAWDAMFLELRIQAEPKK